jgi:hypothetical protein
MHEQLKAIRQNQSVAMYVKEGAAALQRCTCCRHATGILTYGAPRVEHDEPASWRQVLREVLRAQVGELVVLAHPVALLAVLNQRAVKVRALQHTATTVQHYQHTCNPQKSTSAARKHHSAPQLQSALLHLTQCRLLQHKLLLPAAILVNSGPANSHPSKAISSIRTLGDATQA